MMDGRPKGDHHSCIYLLIQCENNHPLFVQIRKEEN